MHCTVFMPFVATDDVSCVLTVLNNVLLTIFNKEWSWYIICLHCYCPPRSPTHVAVVLAHWSESAGTETVGLALAEGSVAFQLHLLHHPPLLPPLLPSSAAASVVFALHQQLEFPVMCAHGVCCMCVGMCACVCVYVCVFMHVCVYACVCALIRKIYIS